MAGAGSPDTLAYYRVLVVEDEYICAEDLTQALLDRGACVIGPVPTVAEALALIEDEPVDVAVLDIKLRGRVDFSVADALRERGVPFVFATGFGRTSIPAAYRDVPRWEKPYKPEDLARVLAGLVLASPALTT